MDIQTLLTTPQAPPSSPPNQTTTPDSIVHQGFLAPATKTIKFTLDGAPGTSMTLSISPNDAPSAITSTVKDFFALNERGVSFVDSTGAILIITPANVTDGMEIVVRQTGFVVPLEPSKSGVEGDAVGGTGVGRKRRKGTLSLRKKSRRMDERGDFEAGMEVSVEEEEGGYQVDNDGFLFPGEKRERNFSSDVSIDNILDSTRRRLTKFSSQVSTSPLTLPNPLSLSPTCHALFFFQYTYSGLESTADFAPFNFVCKYKGVPSRY